MDRAFASGAAVSPPSAPGSPSVGYPTAGNPSAGAQATKPGEYWYYMVTEEIRNVIIDAGMTPDVGDVTQLSAAIQQLISNSVQPAGSVVYVAQSTAPIGYLKANGAAVSRSAYATLFAAIGTTFGAGDGSTTFNLPDMRGEFVRGWDDGRGVDTGRAFGSGQADAMKSHTHKYGNMHNTNYGLSATAIVGVNPGASTGYDTGATGGTETRPRNVALLACIKY